MKTKLLYQLLLLLLPAFSFAQEITGVWKGELYVDSTKKYWPFELTISEFKGKYSGYSRISFEEEGIKQTVFRDHTIKVKDNTIIIEDDNLLAKASSVAQAKEVKKTMILTLSKQDSSLLLDGTWSTNKTKHYLVATGSVKMQKKTDFKSTEIFKKLDELALTEKLSFNKPVAEPLKEEPEIKLDKVVLSDIAKLDLPKKIITPSSKIAKPNPSIKPKEIPFAIVTKEPAKPETKPVVAAAIITKKPEPPVVKSAPVVVLKQPPVVKKENPPVAKASPPVVVNTKPVQPEVKPVAKRNDVLPDQKNAAVDVANRSNNSVQSLYFKSDSLQLTLYDNGEIDGDTVSVLLNGKIIIAKQGLTTKPNIHTIYFDKDSPDSQMLVMYAENLGSIPPNTGLLVVREGAAVYEVRFSADLKTNAAIILRRKKEE